MTVAQGRRINPFKLFNFSPIPDPIMRADISHGAKLIYGRLMKYSGENGVCCPKVGTISQEVHMSDRQVQYYLKELEDLKLIEREYRTDQSSMFHFLEHPMLSTEDGGDGVQNLAPVQKSRGAKSCTTGVQNLAHRKENLKRVSTNVETSVAQTATARTSPSLSEKNAEAATETQESFQLEAAPPPTPAPPRRATAALPTPYTEIDYARFKSGLQSLAKSYDKKFKSPLDRSIIVAALVRAKEHPVELLLKALDVRGSERTWARMTSWGLLPIMIADAVRHESTYEPPVKEAHKTADTKPVARQEVSMQELEAQFAGWCKAHGYNRESASEEQQYEWFVKFENERKAA